MRKKLTVLSASLFVLASSLFGVENVEVVFKKADKTLLSKTFSLVDMPDGARPSIYELTDSTVAELAAMYRFYEGYKRLQLEFMESHEEISKGVFLVKYSDGTDVVVNYTNSPFAYKGAAVAAESYKLFNPAVKNFRSKIRRIAFRN